MFDDFMSHNSLTTLFFGLLVSAFGTSSGYYGTLIRFLHAALLACDDIDWLLAHPHIHQSHVSQSCNLSSFQLEFPESIVESALDSPLDELVAAHLRACWAVAKNDFLEAYKCQALAGKNRF